VCRSISGKRILSIVLLVVKEILIDEILKSSVMNLVSSLTYVKFAHLFVLFPSCRVVCLVLLSLSRRDGS